MSFGLMAPKLYHVFCTKSYLTATLQHQVDSFYKLFHIKGIKWLKTPQISVVDQAHQDEMTLN